MTTPGPEFYRSQFWRLQKLPVFGNCCLDCFIGHNFGDYKNGFFGGWQSFHVLSVTILETTKTEDAVCFNEVRFYRSQFWRLQKPEKEEDKLGEGFIGHNFGDYKNMRISIK